MQVWDAHLHCAAKRVSVESARWQENPKTSKYTQRTPDTYIHLSTLKNVIEATVLIEEITDG